ncbi:polyprenyl synthetase family protein [Nocardia puris]|uniref:Geranylgeranyl diphosphate synthase type I n=1 Tax=Nocardia puris TaxID=208602 RepID=A0A366DEE6_9NOCA|nr:polyprenyl synthetase family protein [Nocardia puris]RBO88432.1 geranylgeranyl diphosphate synthase type I [Nocardia puris]
MQNSPNLVSADRPTADSVLGEARSLFEPVYRTVVETLPSALAEIVGQHRGWHTAGASKTGGRAIRPALVIASARTVPGCSGHTDAVLAAAVSVELAHDFTLIHDDVMDADEMRRGRPAVWAEFGVGPAILAGDALFALAVDLLAERAPAATSTLTRALRTLCEGQSADLTFEQQSDVDIEACLRMAAGKTGALLEAACALGGRTAGGTERQVDILRRFGAHVGLAYQIADDLRGIWAHPAATGKRAHTDLVRRKKTVPVVAALCSDTAAGRELRRRYATPSAACIEETVDLADLVERAGGRRHAEALLRQHCDSARDLLVRLGSPPDRLGDLRALVTLIERWH